jgi:RNA polymerase sigma-70 factor (ECF subfamily)
VTNLISTSVQAQTVIVPNLLELAQRGDAEAFCELCRTYEGRLLRQATVLCGDATLAEDLAQDTLFEAWKCIRRFNGQCHFFTWLCAILLNRSRNVRRVRSPIALSSLTPGEHVPVHPLLENMVDEGLAPDQLAQCSERAAMLQDCLAKLPGEQRQVIYLRFYVDQSLEGIAAALGCSLGTVKSRLFTALEKLRKMKRLSSANR